jgi:hypothetical protein
VRFVPRLFEQVHVPVVILRIRFRVVRVRRERVNGVL